MWMSIAQVTGKKQFNYGPVRQFSYCVQPGKLINCETKSDQILYLSVTMDLNEIIFNWISGQYRKLLHQQV